MTSLTKYRGRWKASIRRKGRRPIYETFDKLSDARSFINKVEGEIQQRKFKGFLVCIAEGIFNVEASFPLQYEHAVKYFLS